MDPVADYLTIIRNAIKANHRVVNIPSSNLKKEITKVLHDQGYIQNYKFEENGPQGNIKIALKYNPETKQSAIQHLERISKPGLRKYSYAGFAKSIKWLRSSDSFNFKRSYDFQEGKRRACWR